MGKKLRLVLAMVLTLCMSMALAACGSKTITGISMDPDTMPETTIGIGEAFTIGDAKIIVTYDNGSSTKWSINDAMVTVDGAAAVGKTWDMPQDVTVTVEFTRLGTTKTTTFDLHIIARGEPGSVDAAILAIDIDGLTYDDLGEIEALAARYNNLTETEKTYVLNYAKLAEAQAKIAALGKEVASVVVTAPVTTEYRTGDVMNWSGSFATITLVNGTVTTVNLTEENAAVTGFDNVNYGTDKTATVTYTYEGVEYTADYVYTMVDSDLEARKADVDAYEALVEKLPNSTEKDVLTYEDVSEVEEARAAYNALFEKWKTPVYDKKGEVIGYELKDANDSWIKTLEQAIKARNEAVDAIVETFIDADDVRYSDRDTIAASRAAYDKIEENIGKGWNGYVTEAERKVLTDSEAVIKEMQAAIEAYRTQVAAIDAIPAYDYTSDDAALSAAYYGLRTLIVETLKYDLSITKTWSYYNPISGKTFNYTFTWSLNSDLTGYDLTITGPSTLMDSAEAKAEEWTPSLYDTYTKQINAFTDANVINEYHKIAAIGMYEELNTANATLNAYLTDDNVIETTEWANAVWLYALKSGMPSQTELNAVNYKSNRFVIGNASMAGTFFTWEDATLTAAWTQLNNTVDRIISNVGEFADLVDDVLDNDYTFADLEIAPLDEAATTASVYAQKKSMIDLTKAWLEETIYQNILNNKYAEAINAAISAYLSADAQIANVQNAIDTAVLNDYIKGFETTYSLNDVKTVEFAYNDLYTLKVTIGYKGTMTAEAFFGANLAKTEVNRTSLDAKEVAFLNAILAKISDPVTFDQQPLYVRINNGIFNTEYDSTGYVCVAEAEFTKLKYYDELNDLTNCAAITTYSSVIETAHAQIANDVELAKNAIDKILAIGYVRLNNASKGLITDARTAYDAIENGWKQLVTAEHFETLLDAEKKLVDLQAAVDAFNALELPAFAYEHYIRTVGETTTYAGAYADALVQYNALIDGHEEIVELELVAEQYAALTALIEESLAEYAKVDALNAAVAAFVPNYDASTAALRADLHAIHFQWKLEGLVNNYVIGSITLGVVKEETITTLDAYDATIEAENDAINAFLAVTLPSIDDLTYTQYITAVPETTYANIFEQSKALYDLLAEYTTENHEEVIARFELLTALYIDIPAQGVEGEEGYVPARISEITRLNNTVTAVEEMIAALSVPYVYAEQADIIVAYNAYKALEKGWIEAVNETLASKIEGLYQKVAAVAEAIEAVNALIAALPATADAMTYTDLPAITKARDAYNAIILDATNTIDAQSIKTLIDDSKLVALEERATKLTDAAKVIQEQIDALDITTYASKNAIEKARADYNAFVENGQGFHVLIQTKNLLDGEAYLKGCDEASKAFLDWVKEMLPSEAEDLTLAQSENIAKADDLYDPLDADIKANNEDVVAAKALVEACKAQDAANKALVEEFVERVEALPVTAIEDDPETEEVESGWNTDGITKDNIDVYEKEVNELNKILATLTENGYVELVKTPGEIDPENPDAAPEDVLWITEEILGKLDAATDKVNALLAPIQAILDEIEAIEKLTDTNTVVDYANSEAIMAIITEKFDALTAAEKNTTIGKKIETYRTSINEMTAKAEAYIEQDKTVVVDELDYTDASRNSVTALREAYDALVDGWYNYVKTVVTGEGEEATTETIELSNENLLYAEAKIASFEAQLANAKALAEAIAAKNFVLEATEADEDDVATVAETDAIAETVIAYSDRAGIVAAYEAFKALADVAGLQQAFDADLKAELIRVIGLVTMLDEAVGTEIADEITAAFNPVYTSVTLDSKPTIDKFFIIIGEAAETDTVKAFRNGWGAYLAVGYKTEYDLLNAALARYNALVEGEAKFKEMVHELCDGKTPADVTYAMGTELTKIREYYKEMFVTDTDRAKIRVFDEYKTLEAFESAWKLKYLEAKDVEKMIDEITSLDRNAIEAAEEAYNKIKDEGKGFEEAIGNYDKLVGYLDELEESYETPAAIDNFLARVNAEDWSSFATVDYGTVSTFLTKVLPNFNALTDEEKAGVSEENQAKLNDLKDATELLMAQLDEIRTALTAVTVDGVDLDDAKGETGVLYLANKALEAVTATEEDSTTAVANKTSWKNALRPELDIVELANAKIEEIKAAMTAFVSAVNALPAKETLDFETAQDVFNAETKYKKLTEDAKADAEVVTAKAKLDEYLAYVNMKGYTSFAEAYAKAVSAFNEKFLKNSLEYSTSTELYFYLETVALPATFTELKVGGVALTNEQISVMVGKTNELKAPAMKTVALADGKVRLSIALPVVATSLNSGNLVISYKDGGETVTKTLSAYTVAVGTNLSLKDATEINHVTGYASEVSKRGSSVAFSSQNGMVGIGLQVNNNSTAVSGVTCAFYTRKSTGSTEVTYGFTTYGTNGVEIYPEYSVGAVTAEIADAKAYDIYLDGYGALTVSVAYNYYKKA